MDETRRKQVKVFSLVERSANIFQLFKGGSRMIMRI